MTTTTLKEAASSGRVVAVLGPTNTGKTYLAIERMLGHRTGMIGFPLRLLARENYDRIVRLKGAAAVALVTGEEKILPPQPRYFVCTVESMPLDRLVNFLAVDEIQLCADPERGHIFTDRLLHARGLDETMFLGADTIRPLLQKLVPRAEFISRPRFSQLSFAGHRKLTRLPPRSAIVAFSAPEVYGLAEIVRRQRGGTAVVLGALSPRTRNAQVALYQAGEVDYLVATDAIGMGLNMDVDHVAFARLVKFDGQTPRRLKAPEIAQIAGRAGRHMADGTFGTTGEVLEREGGLEPELIDAVENHRFEALKSLMWRNTTLDFASPAALLRSLERRPPRPDLLRARAADDQLALESLSRDGDIMALAESRAGVRLLWEVCQIPDFRKVLSDAHTRLLGHIFRHLRNTDGRLPEDWVARQVTRLERTEGDIDALVTRIAHVRTWTYIAHRPDWLADSGHWQERTRALEDALSDALHERLIQRFLDRRSALLMRSLQSGETLLSAVTREGIVVVEGCPVGTLDGFRFVPDSVLHPEDNRALMSAARRALRPELALRVHHLEMADDSAFHLAADGVLYWQANEHHGRKTSTEKTEKIENAEGSEDPGVPVARLAPGPAPLAPTVRVLHDDTLDSRQRERIRQRLALWLAQHIALGLKPLFALRAAAASNGTILDGPARGMAFQISEALGVLPRPAAESLLGPLSPVARQALGRLGVRFGALHVYLAPLTKPPAVALRALLWAVQHQFPVPAEVPAATRTTALRVAAWPEAYYTAIGFPVVGDWVLRVDTLDRLEQALFHASATTPITASALWSQRSGCPRNALDGLFRALGYRPQPPPSPRRTEHQEPNDLVQNVSVQNDCVHYARPRKNRRYHPTGAPPSEHSPFARLRDIAFS